jgi:glycosyltransferase involved in cell wall biosynthesis
LPLEDFRFSPAPGRYLAFLGRISPEKRPDLAIEIARRAGVPLKIAAKVDPADQEYYEARIKSLIDGRFIEYVGEIGEKEKSAFLGGALALLFPIDWPEPFGMAPVEAWACGTPVLARPVGAVPELHRDGVTGFLRETAAELADLVPSLPAFDRAACRAYATRRFSLKRMCEDYVDVYRNLIQTSSLQPGKPDDRRRRLLHPVDGVAGRHRQDHAERQ